MAQSLVYKACLLVSLATTLTACDSPRYVDNNGTLYYDANDIPTDTLPSGPYTKSGQYIDNPDEATNTRDNRGNRPQGYGHDVDEDYQTSRSTVIYPAGTVIYGNGVVVYPGGAVAYPPSQTTTQTTTTVIERSQ